MNIDLLEPRQARRLKRDHDYTVEKEAHVQAISNSEYPVEDGSPAEKDTGRCVSSISCSSGDGASLDKDISSRKSNEGLSTESEGNGVKKCFSFYGGPIGHLAAQDQEWDDLLAASFASNIRAAMPVDVRSHSFVSTPLQNLETMLVLMFDNWKARPRTFKNKKRLLEVQIYQTKKKAHELGGSLLTEFGDFSAPGLIQHIEKRYADSSNIGEEELSRKNKWTAMLKDNDALRGAFSADLLPIIPQLAEKTFDALTLMSMADVFQYSEIAVPLKLEKEQQDFLIALCGFSTVRYELIDV